MRGTQLLVAALFAVSAAACGNGNARNESMPGAAGTSGSATALSMGERHFVQNQLKDGSREVQLGQLAEKNASSPDVKQFAATMVQDHTKAGRKLEEVAQKENVEPEDKSDNDTRDDVQRLSKLSGRDFDKEYVDMMVKDHKDAVDALQDQAENADHPDVKTWAAETLPRVKHHLEMAQQLQTQLNNAGGTATGTPAKPGNKD